MIFLNHLESAHRTELLRFCRRMGFGEAQAEDIVQDVFTAACQTPATEVRHPRAWLYRVTRNRCRDVRRDRPPEESLPEMREDPADLDLPRLFDPATTPAGKAIKAERAEHVHAALRDLDDDLRAMIVMRFWHGLLREELAEVFGLARSGVDHRLNRAVRALSHRLSVLRSSGDPNR